MGAWTQKCSSGRPGDAAAGRSRALAQRAGTSHSTLAAYEAGRVIPTVETFDRIIRAAGYALETDLEPRITDPGGADRGAELEAVLELAGAFPARHALSLQAPIFPVP